MQCARQPHTNSTEQPRWQPHHLTQTLQCMKATELNRNVSCVFARIDISAAAHLAIAETQFKGFQFLLILKHSQPTPWA
ncbi:hypothetical protein BaRGS_00033676 [Batillaria attramentaria]|uniref:Uncharacterized protein n=1 Tax=Batillaria attramentaria TaxID=370345 RepID=A0ABD0JK00_9CAEN